MPGCQSTDYFARPGVATSLQWVRPYTFTSLTPSLIFLVRRHYSGQTSPFSTTSEAGSYHRLALVSRLLPSSSTDEEAVFTRATTEPFALDSYQNLLFSIARFREYTGAFR